MVGTTVVLNEFYCGLGLGFCFVSATTNFDIFFSFLVTSRCVCVCVVRCNDRSIGASLHNHIQWMLLFVGQEVWILGGKRWYKRCGTVVLWHPERFYCSKMHLNEFTLKKNTAYTDIYRYDWHLLKFSIQFSKNPLLSLLLSPSLSLSFYQINDTITAFWLYAPCTPFQTASLCFFLRVFTSAWYVCV